VAYNGKFGPYIKCGSETRSLPAGVSPLDVTLAHAVEILAQPKTRGRGRAAPREPLKTFENSPVTGQPVKLLSGRFGNYVTDGTTNATLPRDNTPESLTFEQALNLLAERAARGPAPPRGRRGRAARAPATGGTKKAAKKTPRSKRAAE
jgi:DNA topoisomerase-1